MERWESLPKPWDRVVVKFMKYLMMEEKSVKYVKAKKGKTHLHQGLLNLLYENNKDKNSPVEIPSRGGFSKLSGIPASKEEKLLGPTRISLMLKYGENISDSDEGLDSHGEDIHLVGRKEEEDHNDSDIGKNMKGDCYFKKVGTSPSDKGPAKDLDDTQNLMEELKCHLKVLNGRPHSSHIISLLQLQRNPQTPEEEKQPAAKRKEQSFKL
eukprot:Gb_34016 [translate_table: standard]